MAYWFLGIIVDVPEPILHYWVYAPEESSLCSTPVHGQMTNNPVQN